MIRFILSLLTALSLEAIEHTSNISLKYNSYNHYSNEIIIQGDTKLQLQNDIFTTAITLEYLYSDEYKERRYIILNELYFSKAYEDYDLIFGKTIKYWGELEGFNIADIYNQKNYLLDPFNKGAKLGSLGFNITRYIDEDSIEFGLKFYEENLKYPSQNSPYYPFLIGYDNELQLSNSLYLPSVYLAYSFITEDSFDSETKIILYHGYDNKRYFKLNNKGNLSQYAYRINKLLVLSNIIYNDTIFKYELSYTDVISDKKMSDYAQISLGLEKTLYDLAGTNISFYLEYYKYLYMQKNMIQNVDISEIYDNDIFLAFRVDFQDTEDSELKSGILYDLGKSERVFKIEIKSRIIDNFVLNSEYLQIISKDNTLLSNIGDSSRFNVGITYTF
ncbi:MAG: hypothetical protein DRG78_13195 [Epsilonproteobacteria bacterium]|nr:MAG: hypothetical protein DRG78_13195 [Campylobacterota bacterium]